MYMKDDNNKIIVEEDPSFAQLIDEAYQNGVDKTIERFANGELLKSDDAQKFYDLAYKAGQEENKRFLGIGESEYNIIFERGYKEGQEEAQAYMNESLFNRRYFIDKIAYKEGREQTIKQIEKWCDTHKLTCYRTKDFFDGTAQEYNKALEDLKKFINTL